MKANPNLIVIILSLISLGIFAEKNSKSEEAKTAKVKKDSKWAIAKKKCVAENKSVAEKKARLYLSKLQKQKIPPYSNFTDVGWLDTHPSKRRNEIYFYGCKVEAPEGQDGVIFGYTAACKFDCTFSDESSRVKMTIEVSRGTKEFNLAYLVYINDV